MQEVKNKILEDLTIILNLTSNGYEFNRDSWLIMSSLKSIKKQTSELLSKIDSLVEENIKLKALLEAKVKKDAKSN